MAQKKHTSTDSRPHQEESYGIEEIIPAILDSSLPEGKKVAFLYMIAEGSFSLQQLEDISLELEAIGEHIEADVWRKKAEIEQLEQQLSKMDQELDELAVNDAQEHQDKLDKFVAYTAQHAEDVQSSAEREQIAHIRKDLSP